MKFITARRIVLSLVVLAVVAGLIFHLGSGTPSSFGWKEIALICPLGAIESVLASWSIVPRVLVVLLVVVVLGIVLGKVFCAWVCPVPPLQRFFRFGSKKTAEVDDLKSSHSCGSSCSSCAEKRRKFDSRHIVLGGSLLSTALFGFPVFCIVCPVGLTFATLIAVWRLVGFNEPSWSLLVFPAILILELLVLRKWCHKFCPLGALMSLMSIPNKLFRPHVKVEKCLRSTGVACTTCVESCPEGLDPHYLDGMHECTKCGICKDNCPGKAISFPPRLPRLEDREKTELGPT